MTSIREQAEQFCARVLSLADSIQTAINSGLPKNPTEKKSASDRKKDLMQQYRIIQSESGRIFRTAINSLPPTNNNNNP